MPSIGSCGMPSTMVGSGMPTASRIVGPMSITWVNWARVLSGFDAIGPGDRHGVARAAQVAGRLLAPLEWVFIAQRQAAAKCGGGVSPPSA